MARKITSRTTNPPPARDPHDLTTVIRTKVPSLVELRKDLDSAELGLGREVNRVARAMAYPVVAETARNAPFDPEHRGHPDDDLPHIKDSFSVRVIPGGAAIVTSHPGGPVWEFGGTIYPQGPDQPIDIPEYAMARRAGEDKADEAEAAAGRAVDRLLRQHNL